ncbi:bifunctional alpha/beta hydrolase/OsmC family protein [Gayadomonas joobiniege]|uniref:bifunctional alpha/beta hydrolase/OsmC family protein n=1 Tax=Gayadomonas joobiniege TaxID=1234606 RepID=UPI00037AC562|nr:bifunctional alpha/beta hydrolase/OsmC family protein [Gayadomonas joobiniege]
MKEKHSFESQGHKLAGLLEKPSDKPLACVLFAHCFTCGKDIAAASRIARRLVELGFAVFRFDFTGLGNSDGDFANTNFSSNIEDLLAASDYLKSQLMPPTVLIGHSLGGAAVLSVASQITSVKAVVTIAAPATADHVVHNFNDRLDEIKQRGVAEVNLAGRRFNIQKQFIDDVRTHSDSHFNLHNKALLVMHSPLDEIVAIKEAEKIYQWAKHPKSFISLDDADHLLTRKKDAEYVAHAISGWLSKYIENPLHPLKEAPPAEWVSVEEKDHRFTQTVTGSNHTWLADEPLSFGGQNLGPTPYDHLLAGLGACTSMTLRLYAERKGWPLEHIKVTLKHSREKDGNERIDRKLTLKGELSVEQRQRLLEIADKCPVHKTISHQLEINTDLN